MPVTAQTLRLVKEMRRDADAVTDAAMRDLAVALVDAWDEVFFDLQEALSDLIGHADGGGVTRRQIGRSQRLASALSVITDRLDKILGEAAGRAAGDLRRILRDALRMQEQVVQSQLPQDAASLDLAWRWIDPAALDAIVERTTQRIHAASSPLSRVVEDRMKRELVRGLASGVNPRVTASRIVSRCRGEFLGGYARAERIARTETLDALRAATMAAERGNSVAAEWMWMASLSARTCPACWGMHGSRHPLDEPGPADHQCGRCARVTVAKRWRDLGIDLDEPADATPDAGAVYAALTPEQQRAILGPARHDAYLAGDYPLSSWSQTRTNDGWRDSIQTTPTPRR